MAEEDTQSEDGGGVATAQDTLSVTDNRTGESVRARDHERHREGDGLPADEGRTRTTSAS